MPLHETLYIPLSACQGGGRNQSGDLPLRITPEQLVQAHGFL